MKLKKFRPCQAGAAWLETQPDIDTAWRVCQRGEWMLWLLWVNKSADEAAYAAYDAADYAAYEAADAADAIRKIFPELPEVLHHLRNEEPS